MVLGDGLIRNGKKNGKDCGAVLPFRLLRLNLSFAVLLGVLLFGLAGRGGKLLIEGRAKLGEASCPDHFKPSRPIAFGKNPQPCFDPAHRRPDMPRWPRGKKGKKTRSAIPISYPTASVTAEEESRQKKDCQTTRGTRLHITAISR